MLSVCIFAIQIGLFGALALYLHYLSEHYGLAPLLFFVAGIVGVFNFIEIMAIFVEPAQNVIIRPGGHVFVPIILLIVVVLYITSGTRTARMTILGLIGIDGLVLGVLIFLWLYVKVRNPSTTIHGPFAEQDIKLTPLFFRGVLASIITFATDMFVITIIYQGIKNAFPTFPENSIPGIALLIALWVDTVLYNILALFGTAQFALGLPGDILMKTLAGLLLSPLAGWYLTRIAPGLTHYLGATDRPTLDILVGESKFSSRLVQLQDELQVSRAIYEQIMEHIGEVFWLVDIKKERLIYLSPGFEKLTGESTEIFLKDPRALLRLVHPDDRSRHFIRQMLLSPETEFRIQLADGTVRWLRNRSFPIVTHDHQTVRYAGIAEDTTIRREIRAQAFELELAREKARLLHRFVRDASHDLRTPLSAIMLKVDLLEKVDPARQKKLQHEMRDAARHLGNLIDNLFTLSRIESQEPIAQISVDFNEIVQQVGENHQIIAQNKNLSLVMNLTDKALRIIGNQDQLTRLVDNLLENAIHYTHQGTITIRTLVKGNQAVLDIVDTGIGIPEADSSSIFERFYRADEARSMRHEGTGLGLAISKAIVEQHFGTITVQSVVGQGTTFQVIFPIDTNS